MKKNTTISFLLFAFLFVFFEGFAQKKLSYQENIDLAKKKFNAKIYGEAIELIDLAIKKKPKVAENYYFKGMCFFRQYKHQEAIAEFDKAIARDKKNWLYYKFRGDAYYNTETYEPALQDYTKAIDLEKSKKNDTLFWYRADTYRKLNRYKEAINDYDKAIALNDKNAEVFYHRAYMRAVIKDTIPACQDYQKAYEMGVVRAQREAYSLLKCAWAVPVIEKDDSPVAISKVEVEPFTGAVITSRGLKYEKYEFVPEKQLGFITSAVFGFDEPFIFRVHKPKGFKEDENGKVFFGAGFGIYENEKELGAVKDLFADNYEGVDAESLSNLRITLRFAKPLETGKIYTLKVRFFDKKSNAEIAMEMPFSMAEKTLQSNVINTTKSILALGAESKATNEMKIEKITFLENGKVANNLKPNTTYQLQLTEISNLPENLNYQYNWVSEKDGSSTIRAKGFFKFNKKNATLNITSPQQKGAYILWLAISAKDNPSHIWAVSYPISVL
ncbi:MAG: tetratricopeptide repeat protein [Raineya sp.]